MIDRRAGIGRPCRSSAGRSVMRKHVWHDCKRRAVTSPRWLQPGGHDGHAACQEPSSRALSPPPPADHSRSASACHRRDLRITGASRSGYSAATEAAEGDGLGSNSEGNQPDGLGAHAGLRGKDETDFRRIRRSWGYRSDVLRGLGVRDVPGTQRAYRVPGGHRRREPDLYGTAQRSRPVPGHPRPAGNRGRSRYERRHDAGLVTEWALDRLLAQ
jgi:hypothetical protein